MKALVINYGMGNLGSVRRALEECGADVRISSHPEDLAGVERIVLPGVGAFPEGMANLQQAGWPAALRAALKRPEVRLLGICLGMQLLAERGYEIRETAGLGIIAGEVHKLRPAAGERLPHVGWNEVRLSGNFALFEGIADGTDFYFVHSYHFKPADAGVVLARTTYGEDFVSAVGCHNVLGTQFHPEKSSKAGFQVLRNFLNPWAG